MNGRRFPLISLVYKITSINMFNKKTSKNEVAKWGIAAGFLECVYVFLVILVLNVVGTGSQKLNDPFQGGLFMLLFFVVSVLISAVLVFGRPVILVLDKKIKEALATFFVSLVTIFIIFLVILLVIVL